MKELGDGFGCVTFPRFFDIVTETTIVSSRTLRVGFPLPTISYTSLFTLLPSDSWPRRSSQNFHFWLQNSYFEFLARYFFSPLSSICDNQVQLSSDESPYCTIPTGSWVSQTLVFLICTILPRCHQVESLSMIIKFRPTSNRIPEYRHLEEQLWIGGHNSRQKHWLQWPGTTRKSSMRSDFLGESGPLSGLLFLQTDSPFELGIMDDFVQCWSNPRIKYFKIRHWNTPSKWRRSQFIHWFNHFHFFHP